MRVNRFAMVATIAALGFGLAACGKSGTPTATPGNGASSGAATGTGDQCASSGVTLTPATSVSITGSPTYDKIKGASKVVVGVKADQPNLGYKDASGQRCGFDIEIAQLIASKLGIAKDKIEYKEIPSANRETAIKGGEIDYYVGTYSITDKRKADVAFAGPYFVAGQDLLVRKDDSSITGKDTLKGKKVCSASGSTPLQRVKDQKLTEDTNISEFKTYSECVSQLLDKRTDAVTTDDAILKGYAAQNPSKLKVVGQPFSTEKYGIGLPHDDKALRDFVNDALDASSKDGTWQKIYDGTLGKSGSPATFPKLERY
jgi:glutamate transport system substrate-binding protein